MRYSPVVNRICKYCGKYVSLCEEDFLATIGKEGKINYFFECPNCQEVDKIDEQYLPGYLKDILVLKANKRESENITYLCAFCLIAIVAIIAYFIVKF